ncbi:MAG: hypothetical protein Q7R85_02355 [bacterium]|nr:hypothetical protein [bacterium]
MKKGLLFGTVAAFVAPLLALAQESAGMTTLYTIQLIPEGGVMDIFHFLNLALGLFAAFYAVKLAALSQGGELEKTWNALAFAAVLFALTHIANVMSALGFVSIGGINEVLGLLLSGTLLYVFMRTRSALLGRILGK